MKIKPTKPGEPPRDFQVRWCMLQGNQIATWIWGPAGEEQAIGVPNLGKFHRVVVATSRLTWNEDVVILVGDLIVRFASSLQGERPSPIDEVHSGSLSHFTSEFATVSMSGKFIEVVAPETNQLPKDEAFTALGLIALVVGPSAVGEVVLDARVEHLALGTMHEVEIARDLRMSRPVRDEDTSVIDEGLQALDKNTRARRGVAVGLRWYEHGIRAGSDVDKHLAFFVGLETVLTTSTKAHGFKSPIAKIVKDQRLPDLLRSLGVDHGDETVSRLLKRLNDPNPNIIDRVVFYQTLRRLDADFQQEFKRLKRLRDDVMHGRTRDVDWRVPGRACEMLEKVLRIELGLASALQPPA
jgi:hypothetical protein